MTALFEHSPWVEARADALPFSGDRHADLMAVVHAASRAEQLALIRAHPELAGKAAIDRTLTEASAAEQASAGLDRLTPEEFALFHDLNARYRERFDFPFIICVRLTDKAGILAAMAARLGNGTEDEIATAIGEIGKITGLRLRDAGLAAHEARVTHDLACLGHGGPNWTRPRSHPDGHVYDVIIVGGGQSGLGAAFGLTRERIANILVLDENPAGYEGPWDTYARMVTLRTPKAITSIDLGIPSLTFRAYWEAAHGTASWEAIDKIPRRDWMDYLRWYRRVLALPVRNDAKVANVEPLPGERLHRVHLIGGETLLARKVVLATGIQGGGEWHTPAMIADRLPRDRYAHTSEAIDFAALRGKRIAVLGGGASAFDNAQHALTEGVAEAHVFVRRKVLPTVNPIRFMEGAGLIPRFPALGDADKYALMADFFARNQPPTNDTFERAARWPGFRLHLGAPWLDVAEEDGAVIVTTPQGHHAFDFLILSTGLVTDPALRPELADIAGRIARWGDRYVAPVPNPVLDAHPYLGPGFQFTPRDPADAALLHGLFAFNYSGLISLGLSASALSGLKQALPRLVAGVADQLFLDDKDAMLADYLSYAEPEFVGRWPRDAEAAE